MGILDRGFNIASSPALCKIQNLDIGGWLVGIGKSGHMCQIYDIRYGNLVVVVLVTEGEC